MKKPRNIHSNRMQHCKIRASQRYNEYIGEKDLKEIVNKIHNNQAECKRISNFKSLVFVEHNGVNFKCVYSNKHKEIITFLPSDTKTY